MPGNVVGEEGVLHAELVVIDTDNVHASEFERIQVGGVLTGRIMPENDPLGGEPALECVLD